MCSTATHNVCPVANVHTHTQMLLLLLLLLLLCDASARVIAWQSHTHKQQQGPRTQSAETHRHTSPKPKHKQLVDSQWKLAQGNSHAAGQALGSAQVRLKPGNKLNQENSTWLLF